MRNSTLFPLEGEPVKPSPDRREPVLWLKRLVILSALDPSAVIRNIEFRRGLNIIQTRQMEISGGPVAGHSVGKTLLMRLIRYSLGETHFGAEETEIGIAATLETASLVTHWHVSEVDWIVIRPIAPSKPEDSFAAPHDLWEEAITLPQSRRDYRDFLEAVNDSVFENLPTFILPRGRNAKWLDVLAWLSRDYQCGYRKANEWRHADANSGPSLDREENSLIMQWLSGLLNDEEVQLRIEHRSLLDNQAQHRRERDRAQHLLETLQPSLREKLGFDEDTEVVEDEPTFTSIDPVDFVLDKIRSLEHLRAERLGGSRVAEIESERERIQEELNEVEATVRYYSKSLQFTEKQIEEYERDPLKPFEKCQAEPTCWMKARAREVADDPAADDHLSDLRSQRSEQQQNLISSKNQKVALRESFGKCNDELNQERARLASEMSGIDQNIGRWKNVERDARSYQEVARSVSSSMRAAKAAERHVDASLKLQETLRATHAAKVARLSEIYQYVLQRIFGPEAIGRIQVDANGLLPVPDKKLAPAGAAMSVMTSVLAFDVACVAASITGIGQHPRFLMHDSPREGEMQEPLFRRLFEVIIDLEADFEKPENISFQYIITTATPLPKSLIDDNLPYVRETLDAFSDDGLLLRRRF